VFGDDGATYLLGAHFHINDEPGHVKLMGSMFVGPGDELFVSTARSQKIGL
jgi:hypothetical protein